MRGNEWTEGNQSSSIWTYPGTPMNPETVVRPEEHYYLRRKVKKRYRFRPKWNILSLIVLLIIGGLFYQVLLGVGYLVSYMHVEKQHNNIYQKGMALEHKLKLEEQRLSSDSYVNDQARKLGMIRDGEKQTFFVEPLDDEDNVKLFSHKKKKNNNDIND
jgi:cell division protein FtsB